jgi:hypothetical protein
MVKLHPVVVMASGATVCPEWKVTVVAATSDYRFRQTRAIIAQSISLEAIKSTTSST